MSDQPKAPLARLVSLDAYRGFIMLAMASGGLALAKVAQQHFPDNPVWRFLGYEFEHVPWTGCSFWDLIQPSFMFMVGVAIPYSHASRVAKGQSSLRIAAHVLLRSVVLILLGLFLESNGKDLTNFTFVNVLTQIGLGYAFVYLLRGTSLGFQLVMLGTILAGYWFLFFNQPVQTPGFAILSSGPHDRELWFSGAGSRFMEHLQQFLAFLQPYVGFDITYDCTYAHWNKNANFAAEFDQWFLNLFPRSKPFYYNEGGYQTLNFVPSMATMILGLMAGKLLLSARSPWAKFNRLVVAGTLCLAVGLVLDYTICPSVKRIWTPSWSVFSAGWTFWMLAGFYLIIDVLGYRRWAFPFVVVGMNSIAMYCMAQLLKPWIAHTLKTHLDLGYQRLIAKTASDSIWRTDFGLHLFGGIYGPIVQSVAVLLVLWLVCLWMYRRGIFLRI